MLNRRQRDFGTVTVQQYSRTLAFSMVDPPTRLTTLIGQISSHLMVWQRRSRPFLSEYFFCAVKQLTLSCISLHSSPCLRMNMFTLFKFYDRGRRMINIMDEVIINSIYMHYCIIVFCRSRHPHVMHNHQMLLPAVMGWAYHSPPQEHPFL